MALTIVKDLRVTGGVDTHADVHVVIAALDSLDGLLGTESFPPTPAGCRDLQIGLRAFGTVVVVEIEGTSSYGAGLARHLASLS